MKPRIAIALPSGDMVFKDFGTNLAQLTFQMGLAHSSGTLEYLGMMDFRGCYIDDNRDKCVVCAKEKGATHIFWVDSDNTYPADTLFRLLDHKTYVVGAAYMQRVEGGRAVGIPVDTSIRELPRGKLTDMQLLGAGVLLTRIDVFDAIGEPYFYKGLPRSTGAVGEDAIFCCRIREAGFHVWADGDLSYEVGHLGVKEFKMGAPKCP